MSQIIPIYIPTYISDQNYNPSRVLPRLFFYNGLLDCEQYYIESGSTNQYGISQAQTAFPYFDNYNVVSGSYPSEGSRTLLFNNEAPAYGLAPTASLYTEYWEEYISLLYNPRTRLLNCSAIIPLADYVKMELNDIVNFRGNYYHLRAINDYSLKDGTCSLQLLGPIIPDVFFRTTENIVSGMGLAAEYETDAEACAGTTTIQTVAYLGNLQIGTVLTNFSGVSGNTGFFKITSNSLEPSFVNSILGVNDDNEVVSIVAIC
jgi:hypothetical protein